MAFEGPCPRTDREVGPRSLRFLSAIEAKAALPIARLSVHTASRLTSPFVCKDGHCLKPEKRCEKAPLTSKTASLIRSSS
jgi:hypothetical protein